MHLKKDMKTLIQIFRKMSKEEFVSIFETYLSIYLLCLYNNVKNNIMIEDEQQNAIHNFAIKAE